MTTTDDLALIGAITGILGTIVAFSGLGLQFYKAWKEKTRLTFTIERKTFSPPDPTGNPALYFVGFTVLVNNEGKRSTTIHSAEISFYHERVHYSKNMAVTMDNTVKPDTTARISFQFYIKQDEINIKGNLHDVFLTIHYTHGKER